MRPHRHQLPWFVVPVLIVEVVAIWGLTRIVPASAVTAPDTYEQCISGRVTVVQVDGASLLPKSTTEACR